MDPTLFFVFVLGVVASIIGTSAGGGGALLTIPGLVLLGLPPHMAIATNKISSLGSVATSLYTFEKAHIVQHKLLIPLILLASIGSFLGANLVLSINEDLLLQIMAVVILLVIPVLFLNRNLGEKHVKFSKKRKHLGYFFFCLAFVYIAFLGAGGGIFVMMTLVAFFGLTFLEANATFRIPWLFDILIAGTIFALAGIVPWAYCVALLFGRAIGGYIGSQIAVHEGNHFVKFAFSGVVIASSIKLFFF